MNCPKCQTNNPEHALFCSRCGAQLPNAEAIPSLGDLPTMRPATVPRRFKTGELILRRYRVTGELGQGGMGVVYKCFDEIGGIDVALKALPPELSHNTVEMEEVRENFRIVERLHHPNIAAVKTLEKDADTGGYYLILECADGLDLRRWWRQKGGKAGLEEVLPILQQIAAALDFAHSQKIIHRDIKPSNVMIRSDGTVKVLDFGLAAQIQTSLSRVSQVKQGTSGTGPYMAPEQWRGQYQDGASDQYALAVMAYELLAGRLPFEGHEPAVLREAVLKDEPPPPEALAAPAWSVLARGLAKNRGERFANCGEMVDALSRKVVANIQQLTSNIEQPMAAGKADDAPQSAIGNRKSKMPLLVVVVVVLALLGIMGWYFGIHQPEERRKAELAKIEAQAKAENDAKEKARLEAEAERLRTEREKQTAADKAKADAAAEQKRQADELARKEAERLANAKGGLIVETSPSGATVTPAITLTDGLVAYYPLAGNANDASGNGNNGTVYGANLVADRFGNPSAAYQFHGNSSSYINATPTSSLNFAREITVSLWCAVDGAGTQSPRLVSIENLAMSGGGEIAWRNGPPRQFVFQYGSGSPTWSGNYANGQWIHLVGVGTETSAMLYVNGVLVSNVTVPAVGNIGQITLLNIGRMAYPGYDAFDGRIDDVRIYNRALSADEIQALYNSRE